MNTENNKLIAEFLPRKTYFRDIDGYSKPLHVFSNNDLIFHSDWNWLIKVVEKIYSLDLEVEEVLIVRDALAEANKANTYQAVIEFIEWYNQQNQK